MRNGMSRFGMQFAQPGVAELLFALLVEFLLQCQCFVEHDFLLNTGLRREELANALMMNIRPIYKKACAILLPLSGESRTARFLGEQSVYAIVKKANAPAADILEPDHPDEAVHIRRVTPHWFGHSYASALDSLGVSLTITQEQLGHESLDTTAIYSDNGDTERYNAVARLALQAAQQGDKKFSALGKR